MYKLIVSILFVLLIVSLYGLAEAKEQPKNITWAKCIDDKDKMFDCKLVDDTIMVNGKVSNYHKVLVGEFYNTVVVLVKDKK